MYILKHINCNNNMQKFYYFPDSVLQIYPKYNVCSCIKILGSQLEKKTKI